MKPLRELMQDKRVAAGLAGLALLFVGYRVATTGKKPAYPVPADNGAAVAAEAAAPAEGSAAPSGAFAAPADNGVAEAVPRGDVVWSWDRNPFLRAARRDAAPAEEGFPRIVVPGFGGKPEAAAEAPPASPEAPPKAAVAEEPLPELRGTVLSGGRGLAIFGSRLVPAGERVAGWTVERVTAYEVTLSRGSERRTLATYEARTAAGKGGNP